MTSNQKLRDLSAKELQQKIDLPEAHKDLVVGCPTSTALLDSLLKRELLSEAARLLSYALPVREAVWWACMCVRHAIFAAALPAEQEAALGAAEEWVRKPSDETRMQAHKACAKAGYFTPAGWAAQAAFASQMSISMPTVTGAKVEKAVFLAAVYGGAEREPERLRSFIASGRDIAAGGAGRLPPATG